MNAIHDAARICLLAVSMATGFLLIGCNQKETLVDVDAPNGGVEVEKFDSGDVTITIGE